MHHRCEALCATSPPWTSHARTMPPMSWRGGTFERPDDSPFAGPIRCSFCGKAQADVARLVCGPTASVAICNECVALAGEIMTEGQGVPPASE